MIGDFLEKSDAIGTGGSPLEPEEPYFRNVEKVFVSVSRDYSFIERLAGKDGKTVNDETLDSIARESLENLKIWEKEYGRDLEYEVYRGSGELVKGFESEPPVVKFERFEVTDSLSVMINPEWIDLSSEMEYRRLISCFRNPISHYTDGEPKVTERPEK